MPGRRPIENRTERLFLRERLRTEHAADDVRARLAQVVRQAGDGRRVEQRDDGDVVADLLLEPVDQHGPLDRVAAQLEEVVVDADLLHSQHLAPEARQEFLQGRARCDVGPGRRGPLGGRRGQGPAVHLAAGGAGQGRERDECGRHHVFGQAILQVAAQRLSASSGSPPASATT